MTTPEPVLVLHVGPCSYMVHNFGGYTNYMETSVDVYVYSSPEPTDWTELFAEGYYGNTI